VTAEAQGCAPAQLTFHVAAPVQDRLDDDTDLQEIA
jgi:hypothetical protein